MKTRTLILATSLLAFNLLFISACTTDGSATSGDAGGGVTSDSRPDSETAGTTTDGTSTAGTTTAGTTTGGTTTDGITSDISIEEPGTTTAPVDGEPPQSDIQSGTLTAADYDDQLNTELYQDYVSGYLQNTGGTDQAPFIDLAERISINVTDSNNEPYSGANITLSDQGNDLLHLKTPATGTATIYPGFDELPATLTLTVSDRFGDVMNTQSINLADMGDTREINVALDSERQSTNELDLLLVIDTTGSMGDELSYLQAELSAILSRIKSNHPQVSLQAGLVVYRDIGDEYVVKSFQFTEDLDALQSTLNGQNHDGGGDYPEAMDQALAEALTLNWREQSNKILMLVADAPPHNNKVSATWRSAVTARVEQIHIVPVAASGVASEAEFLMRAMAAITHSRYVFLTDDSGVGNPHEEPDVSCYIVTRLDSLLVRIVDSLVTGVRQEPDSNEIIRQVGNYSGGRCLTPQQ
ncbi:MAG: VWA domain-containing protein [Granulosicoccus sp.]|nr:VWA domain-containing protein [Granulosicoccus sp.]